jgi:asparagine synthase (glutamine-hydrolysing)
MPFSVWFRKENRTYLRDVLSASVIRKRGLFNSAYVEKLMKDHESGFADHGALLWGLLNVELWQRVFFDTQQKSTRVSKTIGVHAAGR